MLGAEGGEGGGGEGGSGYADDCVCKEYDVGYDLQ
jgi:hypothetical protein